jgi:tetratricopeptide (TPR) repeat protein
LSIFCGGWALDQAMQVCGFDDLNEYEVIDGLGQLASKSLILVDSQAAAHRYRMLETIRQYANEKLLESEEWEAVRNHHLDAYMNLAEQAEPHLRGPQQVEWLDRVEIEMDNLRAALEKALEVDQLKGLRILVGLFWLWHIRGYRVEAGQWLKQMRESLPSEPTTPEEQLLLSVAMTRQCELDFFSNIFLVDLAKKAHELADQLGEDGKQAKVLALHALGMVEHQTAYFEQGLALAEELGDKHMMAECLLRMATIKDERGKDKQYVERHLQLRDELGDLDGMMIGSFFMADYYFYVGDREEARHLIEKALHLAKRVRNRWGTHMGCYNLGLVLTNNRDYRKGFELLGEALNITEELGEPNFLVIVLNALAYAYEDQGDWETAIQYYDRGVHTAGEIGDVGQEFITRYHLAEAAWKHEKHDVSTRNYNWIVELGNRWEEGFFADMALYCQGKLAWMRGDTAAAGQCFRQALQKLLIRQQDVQVHQILESLAFLEVQKAALAARLHGALDRGQISYSTIFDFWEWCHTRYCREELLLPARNALGEAEYDRLYEEGKSLTLEQAVALALGESHD